MLGLRIMIDNRKTGGRIVVTACLLAAICGAYMLGCTGFAFSLRRIAGRLGVAGLNAVGVHAEYVTSLECPSGGMTHGTGIPFFVIAAVMAAVAAVLTQRTLATAAVITVLSIPVYVIASALAIVTVGAVYAASHMVLLWLRTGVFFGAVFLLLSLLCLLLRLRWRQLWNALVTPVDNNTIGTTEHEAQSANDLSKKNKDKGTQTTESNLQNEPRERGLF